MTGHGPEDFTSLEEYEATPPRLAIIIRKELENKTGSLTLAKFFTRPFKRYSGNLEETDSHFYVWWDTPIGPGSLSINYHNETDWRLSYDYQPDYLGNYDQRRIRAHIFQKPNNPLIIEGRIPSILFQEVIKEMLTNRKTSAIQTCHITIDNEYKMVSFGFTIGENTPNNS